MGVRLQIPSSIHLPPLILLVSLSGVSSTTFIITNNCNYSVWPVVVSNTGVPPLLITADNLVLKKGESYTISKPHSWSGRFWGRTFCSKDNSSTGNGNLSCLSGDFDRNGTKSPATLAEFTLANDGGIDEFDVSLIEGYNIGMLIIPQGGTGTGDKCKRTGCKLDLNDTCPLELKVTTVEGAVACKSGCQAFNQSKYCCKESEYSRIFKKACPKAYTYVYDNHSSIYACANADYIITFCPSSTSLQKSFEGEYDTSSPPSMGDGDDQNGGGGNSPTPLQLLLAILGVAMGVPGFVVAILQIWRHI